ncbi:hypothetical protein AB4524_00715 [Vibrio breoganii]
MIKKPITAILFVLLGTLTYLFWLPVKMANSLVTTEFVTQSINSDIREELAKQPSFIEKIENHKGPAKRYLHRTPLTAFTTIDTGMYDVYATYINGRGEWVVRMGIYPDKNAEVFFPDQIGGFSGKLIGVAIFSINKLIEVGVFKPMLYHVTNSVETSFVSSTYKSVPRLVQ